MFCSHCGAANVDGSNFCAGCGALLAPAPSGGTAFSRAPGTPAVVIRHYAGFWRRFAAIFLDGLIVGCGSLAVAVVVGLLATVSGADFATGAAAGYYLAYLAGFWLYFALQESSSLQATIGKRALGIFVTDTEGQRISFGRATGRVFAKLLNTMTIGVGWLLAAFTAERRLRYQDCYAPECRATRQWRSARFERYNLRNRVIPRGVVVMRPTWWN